MEPLSACWFEADSDGMSVQMLEKVAARVFRRDFSEPGFCVVAFPLAMGSRDLRKEMVALKEGLSSYYETHFGESLVYVSMGRFDQQNTTRLHLDGAPERSFLMLGYEPTFVASELHIADYSRSAARLGLSAAEFLARHNPMRGGIEALHQDDLMVLRNWQEHRSRIVVINNCSTSASDPCHTPGVLHGATIPVIQPGERRVINSTMLVPISLAGSLSVSPETEKAFLRTGRLAGEVSSEEGEG